MWLDSTDIFLSQISMLTDWDVLLLQECFRKLDGVNVGAHELFTPSELLGGLRCPAVIVNRKWKGQSMIVGCAARWTAVELDGQMTFISHKGKKMGEFDAVLMEIQEFLNGRPKQHLILGGDFNVSLYGMTDFFHVGESIPRPRTLVDTNDSLRARALHTMVAELDLTVTNRWDERRHTTRAFHTIKLVKSLMGACAPSCRRTHRLGSSIEAARHMRCMWARLPTNRPPLKNSFETQCGQEPHSPLFVWRRDLTRHRCPEQN